MAAIGLLLICIFILWNAIGAAAWLSARLVLFFAGLVLLILGVTKFKK